MQIGLDKATQENTDLLKRVADLSDTQQRLEKALNKSQQSVHSADSGPAKAREAEERRQLIMLAQLQAQEMDAFKAEINMLRRKGGHLYTPAPPAAAGQ